MKLYGILRFSSWKVDTDVFMQEAVKIDGSEYWEYAFLYCDDLLVVIKHDEHMLQNIISKYFELKEASIVPPSIYSEGKLGKVALKNGVEAWLFSSSRYV